MGLARLGHKCVFACEINEELQDLYYKNFGIYPAGDIREISAGDVPQHDLLCAGFPCQPFSKAGVQLGVNCPQWGDLFENHVIRIIKAHKPKFLLMENVPNLGRQNNGNTWKTMLQKLEQCGYEIYAHYLSPHHFGIPQIRERMFIVGSRVGLRGFSWPEKSHSPLSIRSILDVNPPEAKRLSEQQNKCLDIWQDFLDRAPLDQELPSFPIWSMEFKATYPFEQSTPYGIGLRRLRLFRGNHGVKLSRIQSQLRFDFLPSYARKKEELFPDWKIQFISQNRDYYSANRMWIRPWLPQVLEFPQSLQKFEWNCKGERRDIRQFIIQFRASGVRVKRPTTSPSLVAMTTTQVPIIGWEGRFMTPKECSRLQSLDSLRHLPSSNTKAYKALGNSVNAEIVQFLAESLLDRARRKNNEKIMLTPAGIQKINEIMLA